MTVISLVLFRELLLAIEYMSELAAERGGSGPNPPRAEFSQRYPAEPSPGRPGHPLTGPRETSTTARSETRSLKKAGRRRYRRYASWPRLGADPGGADGSRDGGGLPEPRRRHRAGGW